MGKNILDNFVLNMGFLVIKCNTCNLLKDPIEFNRHKKTKSGYQSDCRECSKKRLKGIYANRTPEEKEKHNKEQREHRAANPEMYRWTAIRKNYKLTQEDFERLLESQNNCCAICETDEPGGRYNQWCIDHDHSCCPGPKSCGECVRGLLCKSCNWGLGNFGDDLNRLRNAIEYLGSRA